MTIAPEKMILGGLKAILDTFDGMDKERKAELPSSFLRLIEDLQMARDEYRLESKASGDEIPDPIAEIYAAAKDAAAAAGEHEVVEEDDIVVMPEAPEPTKKSVFDDVKFEELD
jgi:hypothetical protein